MHADPQRGHIAIELDRPRVLIFDNRATWELMKAYGPGFMGELYERAETGDIRIKDPDVLEKFLLIGLRREAERAGEVLTAEQVAEFVRPLTIQPIFAALLVALTWTPDKPRKNVQRPAANLAPAEQEKPHAWDD